MLWSDITPKGKQKCFNKPAVTATNISCLGAARGRLSNGAGNWQEQGEELYLGLENCEPD